MRIILGVAGFGAGIYLLAPILEWKTPPPHAGWLLLGGLVLSLWTLFGVNEPATWGYLPRPLCRSRRQYFSSPGPL